MLMTAEICECGHLKSDHFDFVWIKPEKEGEKINRRWVAEGQGICSECDCEKFTKKSSQEQISTMPSQG